MCLQREIFDSIHQKHLLREFSRTNGLIYEINFFSLRTVKQNRMTTYGAGSPVLGEADLSA